MKHFILLCLLTLAAPVHADPDRISILLSSYHVAAKQHFEQINPGVFLTWEDRDFGLDYSLGAYRNSYGRLSIAATTALPLWERGQTQLAVFAGIALYPQGGRNYALHIGDVVPLAGAQIRHRNFFAQFMPGDGTYAAGVISFGLTFPMGH